MIPEMLQLVLEGLNKAVDVLRGGTTTSKDELLERSSLSMYFTQLQ
jgi:hypothetical protein